MASKDFLVSPCIISNVSVCDVIVYDVIACDVIVCDVTLEHVISRYDKIFSIVSLQDAGSSCEVPEDTVLQTFRLSMDKIFPYDLGKSQDIRIMVVFGVHDFLKVGLINGFWVAQSNFKVYTNLEKSVSHLQTLLRSCFLLCFRHELLMSVAIFLSRFLYQTLAVRTVINPGMSSSPELESVPTSCGDLTWYVKHFSKISIMKAVQLQYLKQTTTRKQRGRRISCLRQTNRLNYKSL